MTTKEIAQAVGKDERTIQRWVKRAGDKMPSAGYGKSANYTLEETIAIIEAGLGKNATGIFGTNSDKPLHERIAALYGARNPKRERT